MAPSQEEELEVRSLVRSYSDEVVGRLPTSQLATVLAAEARAEDIDAPPLYPEHWRAFFESPPSDSIEGNPFTELISVESAKLREKWTKFQNNCPVQDRLTLSQTEPTIDGVIDTVTQLQTVWQKQRHAGAGHTGKVRRMFHRFCGTVDSHSDLLKILPSGNEYVSIFAGSLNAIVKASVNHEHVAEGLADSLCRINDAVADVQLDLELFGTDEMRRLVADLYAHVFLFLGGVMDWIGERRRKRLLDSFNSNLADKFDTEVGKVEALAGRIARLSAQSGRVEGRVTRVTVEAIRADQRVGLRSIERGQAELAYRLERQEREMKEQLAARDGADPKELARCIVEQLMQTGLGYFEQNGWGMLGDGVQGRVVEEQQLLSQRRLIAAETPPDETTPATTTYTRDAVALHTAAYEDYFNRDRVRLPNDPSKSPATVQASTLSALSDWTASPERGPLWLAGRPFFEARDLANPLSRLAATFVDLAGGSGIPTASYFCELRRGGSGEPQERPIPEVQGALALAYALVRQMVELLLVKFETEVDMSARRLARLDGTTGTWGEVVVLMGELLSLMPKTFFCVVDGLQWLDGRESDRYLADVVGLLYARGVKVLYTTTGRSGVLLNVLEASETIEVQVKRRGDEEDGKGGGDGHAEAGTDDVAGTGGGDRHRGRGACRGLAGGRRRHGGGLGRGDGDGAVVGGRVGLGDAARGGGVVDGLGDRGGADRDGHGVDDGVGGDGLGDRAGSRGDGAVAAGKGRLGDDGHGGGGLGRDGGGRDGVGLGHERGGLVLGRAVDGAGLAPGQGAGRGGVEGRGGGGGAGGGGQASRGGDRGRVAAGRTGGNGDVTTSGASGLTAGRLGTTSGTRGNGDVAASRSGGLGAASRSGGDGDVTAGGASGGRAGLGDGADGGVGRDDLGHHGGGLVLGRAVGDRGRAGGHGVDVGRVDGRGGQLHRRGGDGDRGTRDADGRVGVASGGRAGDGGASSGGSAGGGRGQRDDDRGGLGGRRNTSRGLGLVLVAALIVVSGGGDSARAGLGGDGRAGGRDGGTGGGGAGGRSRHGSRSLGLLVAVLIVVSGGSGGGGLDAGAGDGGRDRGQGHGGRGGRGGLGGRVQNASASRRDAGTVGLAGVDPNGGDSRGLGTQEVLAQAHGDTLTVLGVDDIAVAVVGVAGAGLGVGGHEGGSAGEDDGGTHLSQQTQFKSGRVTSCLQAVPKE
ncbi:hypothetical protein PspLS_11307 [Pyricularia sp. CBS 133598]|nr:hypothetical protein PspLS_11307 [Pyricularia sp. CBS 133598]